MSKEPKESTKKESEVVKESSREEATAKLKAAIARAKSEVANLTTLEENCQKIKQSKRVVIAEDAPDKDDKQVFKFALTGGIVLDIMAVVENFISEMKNRTIQKQNELLEELDEFL